MNQFFQTLRRFVTPYKWYIVGKLFFSILTPILNLFAFSLLIPILRILFRIDTAVYQFTPWSEVRLFSNDGAPPIADILQSNINYYLTSLITEYGSNTTLIILGAYLATITLLKVGSDYAGMLCMIPLRTGIVRDIQNQINAKILKLPLGFFSEERKGDIIARTTGDVYQVEGSVVSSLDLLIKNPIMIVVSLCAMILISPELTLFVLVLLPVSGFVMGVVGTQLKRGSLRSQQLWGGLVSMVEETLGGLRVIKAFRAEEMMSSRFSQHNEAYRRSVMSVERRFNLAHPVSELLGTITIAIVLWYGGTLILGNHPGLDASTFIYYLVIFYSIINPAKDLSRGIYSVRRGMASLERVDKILMAESDINDPQHPRELRFNDSIRFEGVSFRYKEQWVLKDINLEVKKGQTVAIVGESGSGKSTLVDLIPRFYDVVKGAITIDGVNIKDFTLKDLRGLMGNVNQDAILFNDTVRRNISFGKSNASIEEIERAARVANAEEFILDLPEQYDTNIGDRGGKLSGGQRQRLSIARAVLEDPDILILDEATSALDTASERLVQEALERLMKDRTTIMIAHRLSTIINADLIIVLKDGSIVEQGTHAELMAHKGTYARLVELQSFS